MNANIPNNRAALFLKVIRSRRHPYAGNVPFHTLKSDQQIGYIE
jgi:hypothetical protein